MIVINITRNVVEWPSQGSADRPYNNEIVIISPNEAKSLSKGLLNLGNITKVVSNRGKAKM